MYAQVRRSWWLHLRSDKRLRFRLVGFKSRRRYWCLTLDMECTIGEESSKLFRERLSLSWKAERQRGSHDNVKLEYFASDS